MASFLYKINHYEQTCGTSRNLLAVFNNLNQPTSKNTDVQKIKLLQINSMLFEITRKEKENFCSKHH